LERQLKIAGGLKANQSVWWRRKPGFEQAKGDWLAKFDYDRKNGAFSGAMFGDIASPYLAFDSR